MHDHVLYGRFFHSLLVKFVRFLLEPDEEKFHTHTQRREKERFTPRAQAHECMDRLK